MGKMCGIRDKEKGFVIRYARKMGLEKKRQAIRPRRPKSDHCFVASSPPNLLMFPGISVRAGASGN